MAGAVRKEKKCKRERASGGMLIGIRKEIIEEGKGTNTEVEGVMEGTIRIEKEKWRVVRVYAGKGLRKH